MASAAAWVRGAVQQLHWRDGVALAAAWLVMLKFDSIDAKFDRIDAEMRINFDRIDAKFDRIDAKFDTKLSELSARIGAVEHLLLERLPATLTETAASRRAVLPTLESDTLTLYRSGDRYFVMSCAHVTLGVDRGTARVRLPDGLAQSARRVYLRSGAVLQDTSAGAGECCLVELDPAAVQTHPLLKDLKAAALPSRLATVGAPVAVGGVSVHGECHGFVRQPEERRELYLLQGAAGPGNSGTALYSKEGLVGVLAGLDAESTGLPVTMRSVDQYSLELTRAQDSKRYAVIPAFDESALAAATNISGAAREVSLDGPVALTVRDGVVEVPRWLTLADSLTTITYGAGRGGAAR